MNNLLLLEDDIGLIDGLQYSLNKNGFHVDIARTVDEAKICLREIFCECPQNLVKQRITPHFLTKRTPNYYEFTTKE